MFEKFDERRKTIVEDIDLNLKAFVLDVMEYTSNKTEDEDLAWGYLQYEIGLLAGELKMQMLYYAQVLECVRPLESKAKRDEE